MLDPNALADNIKRYRESCRMTQRKLAEALCIITQAVSKWETGVSLPDMENFCRIADLLGVSVNQLLGGSAVKEVLIGIDGGGTKTEFVLLDSTGIMLDRTVGAGCNPNVCGLDECLRILREGIDRLDRGGCALRGIYVGGAGFTTGDYAKRIRSALRKRYPNLRIECTTDIMNVIGSAVGDESCLAAICGTGPEVITGSTRLKAGSAQKMVLNMISTGAMIRSGYVCENLMINLKPSNEKLRGRVIRIVRELTGADEDTAAAALEAEDWSIRRAADRLRAAQQVSRQSGRR